MTKYDYKQETKSTSQQIPHWEKLYNLFENNPLPIDQLLVNLGLFQRSSQIAKILFLNELYELIYDIPGVIMEFGTWWGQNLCVFENLRAIYEPFNQNRRVIGFDTYKGYLDLSSKDKEGVTIKEAGYTLPEDYKTYLEELLACHENINVLSNIKKCFVVEGDVRETLPSYFKDNPETIVSLAYIDLALYEPCSIVLREIIPHLVRGSVVMFDELNWKDYPGETIAFKEIFKEQKFTLKNSRYMRDRTIAIMD